VTTKLPRPDLAAYAIAALGILCITGLLLASKSVPDYLPLITMTAMGAGGGMALNTPNPSETIRAGSTSSTPAAPLPRARTLPPAAMTAPAPAAAGSASP
jgi:hypothetical protein